MRQWFLTSLTLGAALTVMLAVIGCGQESGQLLASVGKNKITTVDFDLALSNLPENYQVLAESYKGKRKILENLVKKDLLVQEAERRGFQEKKDIKEKINSIKKESKKKIQHQIDELKSRLNRVEKQVYENVLLGELNQRLKQEGVTGVSVSENEVATYYEDYARKLKILNPAASVPSLDKVEDQIKAILVEEQLLEKLKKQSKVEVKENRFRELYGKQDDIVIDP